MTIMFGLGWIFLPNWGETEMILFKEEVAR